MLFDELHGGDTTPCRLLRMTQHNRIDCLVIFSLFVVALTWLGTHAFSDVCYRTRGVPRVHQRNGTSLKLLLTIKSETLQHVVF